MAFIAAKRLRFGDGFIMPGEPVPVERGRNYAAMLRLGQITEVAGEITPKVKNETPTPAAPPAPAAGGDGQPAAASELDQLSRKELNEHAAKVGMPEPDKLANREAVIDAVSKAKG